VNYPLFCCKKCWKYIRGTYFLGILYVLANGGPELSLELLVDVETDVTSAWFIDPWKVLIHITKTFSLVVLGQLFSTSVYRGLP